LKQVSIEDPKMLGAQYLCICTN